MALMAGRSVHLREESGLARGRRLMTINVLPDDVLVEIFFYVNIGDFKQNPWHSLGKVCRRWRHVVFATPRHLDLRLEYHGVGSILEVPDAWLVLPVILISSVELLPSPFLHPESDQRWDNLVAALESEHYNRICKIRIPDMTNLRWERFAAAMQKPFPELTHLEVFVRGDEVSVLPNLFLGGSAPRLGTLWLTRIPSPSIPKLLLSANDLVDLSLLDIPESGYFSPDAMATALTVMTKLESLTLGFHSPRSRPDPASRPLPPPTRFVLPVLTELSFKGVYVYLEDLLARIDAPLLYDLRVMFFMDLNFDVPQLHRLICHAEQFKAFGWSEVLMSRSSIRLHPYGKPRLPQARLTLCISCEVLEWQLSSLAQVCSSSFPLISTLEELKIEDPIDVPPSYWKDDLENAQWLELLDPFTALKNLYLADKIALPVFSALLELSGERVTEVLPALQNLFISPESLQSSRKAIKIFVDARRRSGHPVSVHRGSWNGGWEDITEDLASGDR